jgi:hypothetical protein
MMIRYLILFGLVLGVPWKFADKDTDEAVWLPFFAIKGTVNATLIESYVHKYSMAAAQIGSSYSWLGKSFARSKEHTQRRSNLTKWACLCCKGPGSSGTVHYIADPWLVLRICMPSNCRGPIVLTISDKQDMTIQGWALRMDVQSWWTDNVIMAWAAEQTCWIVTHFLMLGFQLDLYASSEYCMLYWYLPSASLRPKNRFSFWVVSIAALLLNDRF